MTSFEEQVRTFINQETQRNDMNDALVYINRLQEHARYLRSFRMKLDNYKLVVNEQNLDNYELLRNEKVNTEEKLKEDNNTVLQQKIAFINTYEKYIINKCNGSANSVGNAINLFIETLKLYDVLYNITQKTNKLILNLKEDLGNISDSNELEIKKRQYDIALVIEDMVTNEEVPISQKTKILKHFILKNYRADKEIYTSDIFGQTISDVYLLLLESESKTNNSSSSFFAIPYTTNITSKVLLPKLQKKLTEISKNSDTTSQHKKEVLFIAYKILHDQLGTREDLVKAINQYPKYDSAIGASETKKLINQVLEYLGSQENRFKTEQKYHK